MDFSGLIVTSWITSAAAGSMINVSTGHEVGHMLIVVTVLLIIPLSVKAFFVILGKMFYTIFNIFHVIIGKYNYGFRVGLRLIFRVKWSKFVNVTEKPRLSEFTLRGADQT